MPDSSASQRRCFRMGVQQMARTKAIVRHLAAVEALLLFTRVAADEKLRTIPRTGVQLEVANRAVSP